MINNILLCLILLAPCVVLGQQSLLDETPIQTVNRIMNDYVKQQTDNQDIDENKFAMTTALYALQDSADKKDFDILLKTWLNYSPPNYPTRKLIEPIFYKDKVSAIEKINELISHNDTYAGRNSMPGSDLVFLREKIFNYKN
ncbi:MAG: hypothetical protein ABIT58_08850 [Ferruginibacter sp.]